MHEIIAACGDPNVILLTSVHGLDVDRGCIASNRGDRPECGYCSLRRSYLPKRDTLFQFRSPIPTVVPVATTALSPLDSLN